MLHKVKIILIAAALIALSLFVTACDKNPTDDSELRELGYFSATLHCNGGNINGRESILRYALPDSPITKDGEVPTPAYPSEGFELEGWYKGDVVDGVVVFGDRWDFSNDYMGNEDIVLYAKWVEKLRFTIVGGIKNQTESFKEVLLHVSNFQPNKTVNRPSYDPEWKGNTFVDYFLDAAYTTPATFPITHSETELEHVIYARFISGEYTIARRARDVSDIKASTKLYLVSDIDMEGETWELFNHLTFTGEINGDLKPNGEPMEIKNLSCEISKSGSFLQYENFGLFGIIVGATIKNVAFTDCTFTLTLPQGTPATPINVGLLAGRLEVGTTFSNVYVSGTVVINNLNNNGIISYNGLYGRKADDVTANVVSNINKIENNATI